VKRFNLLTASFISVASLGFLASCDAPGGDGTLWSCATSYAGHAEGLLGDDPTTGRIAAVLYIPRGQEEWVFEGIYEELEGPLSADQKIQEFTSSIDEDGNLSPETGMRFSGRIDLDGRCEAEGTWEFFGDSAGTWEAIP
jgi:hypothetical protein